MVKLRVAVRVIPEDGWLETQRADAAGSINGEKKFAVIVRDPSEWYIGTLALEIQESYKRRYKHELGKIKYLKAEDDCDLDPEDFVSDQLVDEGKAAKDGADQHVTIKVVQEQGRAVRMGSVVPDLTPSHFQRPLQRPPVPKFPDLSSTLGKRPSTERLDLTDSERYKKQRMENIQGIDESDGVVMSIEDPDGQLSPEMIIQDSQVYRDNNTMGEGPVGVKVESPELGVSWRNPNPATIDELEVLPQKPDLFDKLAHDPRRVHRRQNSMHAFSDLTPRTPQLSHSHPQFSSQSVSRLPLSERFDHISGSRPDNSTASPVGHESHAQVRNGDVVSMLNGMKSASPAVRQISSSSAKKFRRPSREINAQLESDIDDSQMSPQSRAAATKIIPRLVQSHADLNRQVSSGQPELTDTLIVATMSTTRVTEDLTNSATDDEDSDKENEERFKTASQSPESRSVSDNEMQSVQQVRNGTFESAISSSHISDPSGSIALPQPALTEPEVQNSAGLLSENPAKNKDEVKSTTTKAKSSARKGKSKEQTTLQPHTPDSASPGQQLSESLAQYTPESKRKQKQKPNKKQIATNSESGKETQPSNLVSKTIEAKEDDVMKPPESSDGETDLTNQKKGDALTAKKQTMRKIPEDSGELRCYTCWTKKSRCDNKEPICSTCEKHKKNCQLMRITKTKALKIQEDRRASTAVKKSNGEVPDKATSNGDRSLEQSERSSTESSMLVIPAQKQNTEIIKPALVRKENKKQSSAAPKTPIAREQSSDTHNTNSVRPVTLPPGMTQEEYDALVRSREGLTEDKRYEQKRALQKKSSTPALKKTPSHQSEDVEMTSVHSPAIPGSTAATSKRGLSFTSSKKTPTPSISASAAGDKDETQQKKTVTVPRSIDSKTESTSPVKEQVNGSAKKSVTTPIPKRNKTSVSAKVQEPQVSDTINTPKPATKPQQKNPDPVTSITKAVKTSTPASSFKKPEAKPSVRPSIANAPLHSFKNLKELTAQVSQQNSAANSPRPSVSASIIPRLSSTNQKPNSSAPKKFSLDDDSDSDSDSESESSSDSEKGSDTKKKKTVPAKQAAESQTTKTTVQKGTTKMSNDKSKSETSSSDSESDSDSDDTSSDGSTSDSS